MCERSLTVDGANLALMLPLADVIVGYLARRVSLTCSIEPCSNLRNELDFGKVMQAFSHCYNYKA